MATYVYKGKRRSLGAWAKELRIPYQVLYSRLHHMRWTVKDTFGTPVRRKMGLGMKWPRVYSLLKVAGKCFVFLYPKRQAAGDDFAEIRETREGVSLVKGSAFEGGSSRDALKAVARTFGFKDGNPALAWIEGCFMCARAHRRLQKSIEEASTSCWSGKGKG